jgi:hypothetical protein
MNVQVISEDDSEAPTRLCVNVGVVAGCDFVIFAVFAKFAA